VNVNFNPRPCPVITPLDRKLRYLAVVQVRNASEGVQAQLVEVVEVSTPLGAEVEVSEISISPSSGFPFHCALISHW
jgi:hypothetical protein